MKMKKIMKKVLPILASGVIASTMAITMMPNLSMVVKAAYADNDLCECGHKYSWHDKTIKDDELGVRCGGCDYDAEGVPTCTYVTFTLHENHNTNGAGGKCSICGYAPTSTHQHSWATAWTSSETHHWHVCTGENSSLTCLSEEGAAKAPHNWVDGECSDCSFTCQHVSKTEGICDTCRKYIGSGSTTPEHPECKCKNAEHWSHYYIYDKDSSKIYMFNYENTNEYMRSLEDGIENFENSFGSSAKGKWYFSGSKGIGECTEAGGSSTTYTVHFDANGGTGTMADVADISGSYTLPACTFTAPEGKEFDGWAIGSATGEKITTATIDVTAETTLYAVWKDKKITPPQPQANSGASVINTADLSGDYNKITNKFVAGTMSEGKVHLSASDFNKGKVDSTVNNLVEHDQRIKEKNDFNIFCLRMFGINVDNINELSFLQRIASVMFLGRK